LHALFADGLDTRTIFKPMHRRVYSKVFPIHTEVQCERYWINSVLGERRRLTELYDMPDFVFRKIGKQHWANQKDHKTKTEKKGQAKIEISKIMIYMCSSHH